MNAKPLIMIGAVVGSTLGGLVPGLWHASFTSFAGIFTSMIGGVIGIWMAWKIGQRYF